MEQMKNEIIQVISKYVEIDVDGLDIKVKLMELEDEQEETNHMNEIEQDELDEDMTAEL